MTLCCQIANRVRVPRSLPQSVCIIRSHTLGQLCPTGLSHPAASNTPETDEKELARLEQLAARHEAATSQPDPALDWLNRLTYAHLEQRQQVPSGEPPSLLGTPGVLWAAQFRPSS